MTNSKITERRKTMVSGDLENAKLNCSSKRGEKSKESPHNDDLVRESKHKA